MCLLVVVGRLGVPSLFFLARLRVLSLCRITLLWVDILVCCPVELFGTSPVREIGHLWSWCLTQLLSHVFFVAVCVRVGRVVGQLVRDFSWTGCFALWRIDAISEEQWWVVLGYV